uniref:Putative structural protein n=1 Tax=viral metagenome TaxID=1070528 RepID=A0A6H1ZG10_9ZZZZ
MAWREIAYTYPSTHTFQKHLLWLDKNANIYFAMRVSEDDSWTYYAGNASHGLETGNKLTQYSTEASAQTNYLTTTRDATTGKFLALLPINFDARFVKLFVQSGSAVTIYEWWPSTYLSAHEIVSGELLITNALSDAPCIKIEIDGQERGFIGNLGSDVYGSRYRDAAGNIIFESSNSAQNLAGWTFDVGHLYKLASGTPDSSPNDGVILRAVNPALLVYEDTAKRVEVGYLAAGIYGIKGYDTGGSNVIFELSDTQQKLAGWLFDVSTLKSASNTIVLDAANETITVGSVAADGIQIASAGIRAYDGGTQKGAWDVDSGWWLGPSTSNRRVEWDPDTDTFYIRGNAAFDTIVFQEVLTTKGSFVVAKSGAELFLPCTATGSTFTIKVTKPVSGGAPFVSGDACKIDNGINSTWFTVGAGSDQTYYYQYTATYQSGSNSATYKSGTGIVDYGQSGQGFHLLTVDEANSPRYSIYTHAGSPWSTTTELMRFGNLNGFLGYSTVLYGLAVGETNAYLKYDPTNGMRIKGNITAESGTIGGFTLGATTLIATNLILDAGNQEIRLGSGNDIISLDAADATYRLAIGHATYASAPFRVTKEGSLTAISGTIGGWTLASTTLAGGAITLDSTGRIRIGSGGDIIFTGHDTSPGDIISMGTSMTTAVFTGAGLDDMTSGGTFNGTYPLNYKVQIDGTGSPNTFKWSDDGGVSWDATGVAITGGAQTLNNGVTVTFGATTGHTLNNYWTFSTYASRIGTGLTGVNVVWRPQVTNTGQLRLGYDAVGGGFFDKRWDKIYLVANSDIQIESLTNIGIHARPSTVFGTSDWKQALLQVNWDGSRSLMTIGAGFSATQYIYMQYYGDVSTTWGLIGSYDAGGTIMSIDGDNGNCWFVANVSALSFTDRTPFYEGDALTEIKKIKSKDGKIDHSTLPVFAQKTVKAIKINNDGEKVVEEVLGRDLGAIVSILTVGLNQLASRLDDVELKLAA